MALDYGEVKVKIDTGAKYAYTELCDPHANRDAVELWMAALVVHQIELLEMGVAR